jgi:putative ABC transport system permease protein
VSRAAPTRRPAGPRLRPRWNKVLADLWSNRVRSLLVVASVAVGLFAVGMIVTMHAILSEDMRAGYEAVNPANVVIYAADFDDELVEQVRNVDGVASVEGLRVFDLMVRTGPGEWSRISISAVPDAGEKRINRPQLEQGAWPPEERQIVVERYKLGELRLAGQPGVGGLVDLRLPSGKLRQVPLAGVVHDQTVGAGSPGGFFLAPIQGYVSADTLEWLEQPPGYNRLLVTAAGARQDEAALRALANRVSEEIEDAGGLVFNAQTHGSRDHPNASYVDGIAGVLFVLGALVVFLSGFLITNTLSALLNQQSKQVAIMKTVGARSFQVTQIYMALIFVFGLLALAASLPLSRAAAFRLLAFLSGPINFDVQRYRTIPLAVALQVVIALVVPQAAGILPILRGARVRIQDALTGSLAELDPTRRGWLDRRLAKLKGMPRPLLISLRNTFRHKGRLALTLVTLTLGGAIFIATFNVRESMEIYVQRVGRYFMADVNVTLDGSYRIEEIQAALHDVPGVRQVEGWSYGRSELLLENDEAGDAVQLLAPPVESGLIDPILLAGRWVVPGDQNAIVLSERFLSRLPGIQPGDTLRLRVNGEESEWVVVGFFQLVGKSAGLVAYTSAEYLAGLIGERNHAPTFRVITDRDDLTTAEQRALGAQVEATLQARGFGVTEVSAGRSLVENTARPLNVMTAFLLIMAALTAMVGSIGLMGTMSMNVLDRTREIGVLRAIGASDRAVMNMVIVEGLLIGVISWALSVGLAAPISKLMADTIHLSVFDARSEFTFTAVGPLAWLGLVLALSVLASYVPARSAARITVREALAYE